MQSHAQILRGVLRLHAPQRPPDRDGLVLAVIAPEFAQCSYLAREAGKQLSTLTIRLPDDKHERLKVPARSNSISVNKLMDELAIVALANYDARVRFETRAARGNPKRALSLLDKLDRAD